MARIISQLGKVAGAVSSIIAASYGGAVVIRSRNPKKRQVNSVTQVESKAKLKLLGQIAAELAPVIVIPHTDNVTSRNLFIKKNYDLVYCNEDIAQLTYENLQITGGMAGLPPIFVQREPSKGVQVRLAEDMQSGVDRVVYILYKKTIAERLVFVDSVIAHTAGEDKLYPAVLPYTEGDIIVLAYGMKDVLQSAAVKYGEMKVSSAMDVAQLYLRHIKGKKDTIFTMTRGTTLFDGQQESEIVPEGYARVFVTAFGDGSVGGAGIFRIGDMVTISATPDPDNEFVGWMLNGSDTIISTDANFTFVLTGQTDYVAMFKKSVVLKYLQYIECNGAQYINTGITPSSAKQTFIQFAFQLTDISSGRNQSIGSNRSLLLHADPDVLIFRAVAVDTNIPLDTNWHEVSLIMLQTLRYAYLNDREFSNSFSSSTFLPFYIFAANFSNVSEIRYGKYRLSYLKIYENDVLVRDYVPVSLNGVGYMYDRINDQLYGNEGSGDFILGPEIS